MNKITRNLCSQLEKVVKNLTIHQRVALFASSSLFVLGVFMILIINIIAPRFITISVSLPNTIKLVDTVDDKGNPITILVETPAPQGYTVSQESYLTNVDPITSLRLLSLVSLVVISGIGVLLSRWLARISLQPISTISQKANHIDSISLNQRLDYKGPQDEVKVLADTIDSMLKRLDTNFERQGQFIGNLAHELRTPLSVLRINIEELNLDPETMIEEYQKLVETTERSLSRLEQLVEDMLLLAKGENEIVLQPVILGALIDEVLEELAPLAQERKISLNMSGDIDVVIMGDEVLLQSAISNLVENAVLYNRPGGYVEVIINEVTFNNEKKNVIIEVKDNGIGIADDDQAKIFERFYRANKGQSDRIVGKGLGLAILKHIVELHQGNIEVESKLGEGSTFRITLPSFNASKVGNFL
jgi:signal transduction histidine kinase